MRRMVLEILAQYEFLVGFTAPATLAVIRVTHERSLAAVTVSNGDFAS